MSHITEAKEHLFELISDLNRYAEFGKISASVLHEISSPVTAALLNLDDPDEASIERAKTSLLQLNKYIHAARNQLRGYSCQRDFNLLSQIRDIKRILLPLSKSYGSKVTFTKCPSCRLTGDPARFQQLIISLVTNAMDAYPNDSHNIKPNPVRVSFQKARQVLIIKIQDQGQGISSTNISRIFDPLFSSKPRHENGLGLGMLIAKDTIEKVFHGSIDVASDPGAGTVVSVKIPVN
ncbi:MAG TPA: HAMP domain-containing sensor histidine kinase [Candidatus Saccharimonadales bacterium]|nr:HAMP domain-containing sensor histidine kinase [Candidatus Saccharimonadales bacterium]